MTTLNNNWKGAPAAVRRIHAQEGLIDAVGLAIRAALKAKQVNQAWLANKLGKTGGFVSQLLNGGNLTLKTLADIGFALGFEVTANFVVSDGLLQIVASHLVTRFDQRAANVGAYVSPRAQVRLVPDMARNTQQETLIYNVAKVA